MSEQFVVYNPSGPDFEFDGEHLVRHVSPEHGTVNVYRTDKGRYLVTQKRPGLAWRPLINKANVYESEEELKQSLAASSSGKSILEELGITFRQRL